jgi:hypothetical protein
MMTRQEAVAAYARAHADLIRENGIPTSADVTALRASFGLECGTREEWVTIRSYIDPLIPRTAETYLWERERRQHTFHIEASKGL